MNYKQQQQQQQTNKTAYIIFQKVLIMFSFFLFLNIVKASLF